jgi:DNA-binding NarL/FixJ family response regulator
MTKINLFLVDDHEFVLDGMASIINHRPKDNNYDLQIIGRAKNMADTLSKLENIAFNTHIVVMDISLEGASTDREGIEALKVIKQKYPNIKVVMFSMHPDRQTISVAMNAGMDGYILKGVSKDRFLEDLIRAWEGKFPIPDSGGIKPPPTGGGGSNTGGDMPHFTERERQIICLLVKEQLNGPEIAARLKIKPGTVEVFRRNIMEKMVVNNAVGIAVFAIKNNLCSDL